MPESQELPFGTHVLRLEGGMLEVADRAMAETLRIHVNHVGVQLVPLRDGRVHVKIGHPKRWIFGMPGGPDHELQVDDLQQDSRGDFRVAPEHEPALRAFFAEAARRRTIALPGSPTPDNPR